MKVLASGVFDLLHYGHIRFLEEAKKLGEPNAKLIVIVASDDTVARAKGRSPIIPEDQRRLRRGHTRRLKVIRLSRLRVVIR